MTTPVERLGGVWAKRDDLYRAHGAPGGKARTCLAILSGDTQDDLRLLPASEPQGETRLAVTASSRHSPQAIIVARIAAGLGMRSRIHMPTGDTTPEIMYAEEAGAEIVRHRPGYNSVIVARAKHDALTAPGAIHVPFGMECWAAVEQTALELTHTEIPPDVNRIVVPVGSGMSLAGVLRGMADIGLKLPVVGVQVGADPTRRLDRYAVSWWRDLVKWEYVPHQYDKAIQASLGGVKLDPIYEAKCEPFLRPGDLFWMVGIRANLV